MAILSAILLASENEKLYIENQRQKRKRAQRRTYIAKGGVLSGAEGLSRAQAAQKTAVEGAVEAAAVRDIIAVPRVALRATPGHPSDVRRSRTGGTCF
jgi:hypothetical protein